MWAREAFEMLTIATRMNLFFPLYHFLRASYQNRTNSRTPRLLAIEGLKIRKTMLEITTRYDNESKPMESTFTNFPQHYFRN